MRMSRAVAPASTNCAPSCAHASLTSRSNAMVSGSTGRSAGTLSILFRHVACVDRLGHFAIPVVARHDQIRVDEERVNDSPIGQAPSVFRLHGPERLEH